MYRFRTATSGRTLYGARIAKPHHHDFRRHAEPHRGDRAAEPARHDHVAAVLDDVAVGETVAVPARYDRRIAEDADLAAMRVAGERQRNARRYLHENIRLMRKQDRGRIA